MKTIEIDDELYRHIASQTQYIGESASAILRRMLNLTAIENPAEHAAQAQAPSVVELPVTKAQPLVSLSQWLDEDQVKAQKGAVGRFLYILSMLFEAHGNGFDIALQIKGRDRMYFATSKEALLANGSSTNPKQIPNSPYWVICNTNTDRKRAMLAEVCEALGYQAADIEILIQHV